MFAKEQPQVLVAQIAAGNRQILWNWLQ